MNKQDEKVRKIIDDLLPLRQLVTEKNNSFSDDTRLFNMIRKAKAFIIYMQDTKKLKNL